MSGLHRVLPGGEMGNLDDATVARLQRALGRLEPDPLFRRRLRGVVLNHHVAAREGHLRRARPRRRMGTLGRSVLYASLLVAMGVSAVGAAAQDSLPGEALYEMKLQLEEIRMRIAPPSVHDDLAAIALAERIDELQRLAAAGAWKLVPAAANRVARAEEAVMAADADHSTDPRAAAERATEALEAVMVNAPEAAKRGLERAWQATGGSTSAAQRGANPPRGLQRPTNSASTKGADASSGKPTGAQGKGRTD